MYVSDFDLDAELLNLQEVMANSIAEEFQLSIEYVKSMVESYPPRQYPNRRGCN